MTQRHVFVKHDGDDMDILGLVHPDQDGDVVIGQEVPAPPREEWFL